MWGKSCKNEQTFHAYLLEGGQLHAMMSCSLRSVENSVAVLTAGEFGDGMCNYLN